MAQLKNTTRLSKNVRGYLRNLGNSQWSVAMPMGIKNRRIADFEYDFSGYSDSDLLSLLKFSKSNAKLKKTAKKYEEKTGQKIELWAFNLPALLACPGALECAFFCYALQGQFGYRNVMEARAFNFALLHELHARGGEGMVTDALTNMYRRAIAKTPKTRRAWFRIHDSGDMFKLWYFRAQVRAVAASGIDAYLYTKAVGMLRHVGSTPGLRIVQSVGGTMDAQLNKDWSHSAVFETVEERIAAGYVDGNESDIPAMMGETRIGLVYHGTEKLKAAA